MVAGFCVTAVAAALEGTAATALFAAGLPAMLAGVVLLEGAPPTPVPAPQEVESARCPLDARPGHARRAVL